MVLKELYLLLSLKEDERQYWWPPKKERGVIGRLLLEEKK
jgi:hypothetical protein